MSLDIAQVARQFQSLLPTLRQSARAREAQLALARQDLLARGDASRPGGSPDWRLLRGLTAEEPFRAFPLPRCPEDYSVLATDGSQIDIDRHAPVSYYLINIGEVFLRYGSAPAARLANRAGARLSDESFITGEAYSDEVMEEQDRVIVALERAVAEPQALLELARSSDSDLPTLALIDGTLALWTFGAERFQPRVGAYIKEYEATLRSFRELAAQRPLLSLASYISFPGSAEITKVLKLDNLLDRQLFGVLLRQPGERSPVFESRSKMQEQLGVEGPVHFFYLNSGQEISRVEAPAWVAQNPERLDMAHAILYDQCQRNFGYPVALMEAHQQAVVSEADRQTFWQLVSNNLEQEGLSVKESDKSRSKRVPWA